MSKFFHLGREKLRLSAIVIVGDVKPHHSAEGAFAFEVTTHGGEWRRVPYDDEPTAIAVHTALMNALENESE